MFERFWGWVLANKEWLFSGLGIAALGALVGFLRKRGANGVSLTNKAGAASQNIQAGRDLHLTVLGDDPASTHSPRQQFVADLVKFCSDSSAATTKLFLALRSDASRENAVAAALMECERHNASSQMLQLRASDTVPESGVQRELFELLRRTSLARQSLAFTREPYKVPAFSADQGWVDAQARRVISVAARAAGYDLERSEVPFLIGFQPSFVGELPGETTSGQPPSAQIIYEGELARLKAECEASGHKWDPSKFPRYQQERQAKDAEVEGIPRRDSEPDISDGRVRDSFPFEERHHLWLAGYDSRPALVFADGRSAQMSVRLTTRVRQPMKLLPALDAGRHPIDLISPHVAAKASQLLKAKSSSTAQRDVENLQDELRSILADDFAEYGYELATLSIHIRLA